MEYTIKVDFDKWPPDDEPTATVTVAGTGSGAGTDPGTGPGTGTTDPDTDTAPEPEDEAIAGDDVLEIIFDGDKITVTYEDGTRDVFGLDDYNLSVVFAEARFTPSSAGSTVTFRANSEIIHDGARLTVTATEVSATPRGRGAYPYQFSVAATTRDGKTEIAVPVSSLPAGTYNFTFDSGTNSNPRYRGILATNYQIKASSETPGTTPPAVVPPSEQSTGGGGGCDASSAPALSLALLCAAFYLASPRKK